MRSVRVSQGMVVANSNRQTLSCLINVKILGVITFPAAH
jgi:hypothetical protein